MKYYICSELSNAGECLKFVEHISVFDLGISDAQTLAGAIAALWVTAWAFKMLRRAV